MAIPQVFYYLALDSGQSWVWLCIFRLGQSGLLKTSFWDAELGDDSGKLIERPGRVESRKILIQFNLTSDLFWQSIILENNTWPKNYIQVGNPSDPIFAFCYSVFLQNKNTDSRPFH